MKKITVIGGDNRLVIAADVLSNSGYKVKISGLSGFQNDDSDVWLLPVPTTKDGETLFAPLSDGKIYLKDIEREAGKDRLILTCNHSFKNNRCIDYGKLDSFCLLNAIPTAEGAISLAIENTPFTLWGSRVLVIGYGRVGKILAERLKGIGCRVTVSARKPSDFAMINACGYYGVNTADIKNGLDYDIIFNTVDFEVIPESAFEKCSAKLIIDLSSKGGFSIDAAKNYGITALKAPGIPGKTAPLTAGEILARTVKEIIEQQP